MKLFLSQSTLAGRADQGHRQRGAALMLSFMVLLVLILILAQIKYSTDTAARVARNEETVIAMDLAIESALLQVYEDLKTDGESDSASGSGDAGAAGGGLGGADAAGSGGGGGGPSDSREDEWARPQRTELNEIQLRILIQDEDSKFNVLSVLTEDEDEADKALDRLTRVIELARKGTEEEIDGPRARAMATTMKEFMLRRTEQVLPKPVLLSDDAEEESIGLMLSLRELVALDPELFPEDVFREFIDESGAVVHSLGAFLTVWSSVATLDEANAGPVDAQGTNAEEQPEDEDDPAQPEDENQESQPEDEQDPQNPEGTGEGEGTEQGNASGQGESPPPGWAINVNTAPSAVLHALLEDRELPYRFWDSVIQYRNEEDESVEENEEPPLDEYGREIIVYQFFRSLEDLAQVDGWENIEPIVQGELKALLKTQSQVFSVTITARKPTGDEQIGLDTREEDIEREEARWQGLVRTVRAVVWRHVLGEGEVEIVPLVRWEVLDYTPYEVLDYPERRDFR